MLVCYNCPVVGRGRGGMQLHSQVQRIGGLEHCCSNSCGLAASACCWLRRHNGVCIVTPPFCLRSFIGRCSGGANIRIGVTGAGTGTGGMLGTVGVVRIVVHFKDCLSGAGIKCDVGVHVPSGCGCWDVGVHVPSGCGCWAFAFT
jgi:hypothetical protein